MNCKNCLYRLGYCPYRYEPTDILGGYCDQYIQDQDIVYDGNGEEIEDE